MIRKLAPIQIREGNPRNSVYANIRDTQLPPVRINSIYREYLYSMV